MSAVTAALTLLAGNAWASGGRQWGYSGAIAPEHWGSLDPAYILCATGMNQSPINLTDCIEAELEPIKFQYSGLVTEIVHNGHTIQAKYTAGSTISLNGHTFALKRFHFHTPSEHLLNGEQFPLEAQFVHADPDGNLAVIAVLYSLGEENAELEKIWRQMPAETGRGAGMSSQVRADDLMPENKEYYRFNGSLTTPPCTEGVLWLVMKHSVPVSEAQVKQLADALQYPNNRPVQPINARPILQ
ncbi:MAG: carbonic anhydrase family protein [Candidatus Electrothrix sp. EH2]|nr:carbonic anhydrase family protein [Candidatus Electrothrix sp. EH2]